MEIFVHRDGQQLGPFDEATIRDRLSSGELNLEDLGWAEGRSDWEPLHRLLEWESIGDITTGVEDEHMSSPSTIDDLDSKKPASDEIPDTGQTASASAVGETFGYKLGKLFQVALRETKRYAQLAAIKGKAEKVKHVDLLTAYQTLGRKAYELKVSPDRLSSHYQEIAAQKKKIEEKRAGIHSDSITGMEKMKNVANNAKIRVEAEVLEWKLRQNLIAVGKQIQDLQRNPELQAQLDDVRAVELHIAQLEKDYCAASADKEVRQELKRASKELAVQVGSKVSNASYASKSFFRESSSKRLVLPAIAAGFIVLAIFLFVLKRQSPALASGMHGPTSQALIKGTNGEQKNGDTVSTTNHSTAAASTPIVNTAIPTDRDTAKREYEKIVKAYGMRYDVTVQRKLNPEDFSSLARLGNELYQVVLNHYSAIQYEKRDLTTGALIHSYTSVGLAVASSLWRPSPAILITSNTTFTSSGNARVLAKPVDEVDVTMENGFAKKVPVFLEQNTEQTTENRLVDLMGVIP